MATETPADILSDAYMIQEAALERLNVGDIRDAAEKSWCATKRATDALLLARTGELVESSSRTSALLRMLSTTHEDVRVAGLRGRYYARQNHLHGECFYIGLCDPVDDTARVIRETGAYVDDVERLLLGPHQNGSTRG